MTWTLRKLAIAAAVPLALAACDKKSATEQQAAQASGAAKGQAPAAPVVSSGTVTVIADDKGFTPASVTIPKGSKGEITFKRTSDETCATEVVFPDLKIKKDLPLNTPVTITVPTDKEHTFSFQCGMAMFKGAIVVQ